MKEFSRIRFESKLSRCVIATGLVAGIVLVPAAASHKLSEKLGIDLTKKAPQPDNILMSFVGKIGLDGKSSEND